MRLDALLRAHGFMRVERPPQLWDADTDDPPPGDYVAVTVSGKVAWESDAVWQPGRPWQLAWIDDLTGRLDPAGARYAYIRKTPAQGSITVFLARSGS